MADFDQLLRQRGIGGSHDPVKVKAARLLRGYRAARPNAVMASPPTITIGAAGAASPISSPVAVGPLQANTFPVTLGLSGGIAHQTASGTFPSGNYPGRYIVSNAGSPIPHGTGFRMRTHAHDVAFQIRNTGNGTAGSVLCFRVNGEWTSLSPTSLVAPGDAANYWVRLQFADAALREIDVFGNPYAQFRAINLAAGHVALPTLPPGDAPESGSSATAICGARGRTARAIPCRIASARRSVPIATAFRPVWAGWGSSTPWAARR
jgi:hypothetical protein